MAYWDAKMLTILKSEWTVPTDTWILTQIIWKEYNPAPSILSREKKKIKSISWRVFCQGVPYFPGFPKYLPTAILSSPPFQHSSHFPILRKSLAHSIPFPLPPSFSHCPRAGRHSVVDLYHTVLLLFYLWDP